MFNECSSFIFINLCVNAKIRWILSLNIFFILLNIYIYYLKIDKIHIIDANNEIIFFVISANKSEGC